MSIVRWRTRPPSFASPGARAYVHHRRPFEMLGARACAWLRDRAARAAGQCRSGAAHRLLEHQPADGADRQPCCWRRAPRYASSRSSARSCAGARRSCANRLRRSMSRHAEPPTSTHAWLHLPEPWRGAAFARACLERGVGVLPGGCLRRRPRAGCPCRADQYRRGALVRRICGTALSINDRTARTPVTSKLPGAF